MPIAYGYKSGMTDPQLKLAGAYTINLAVERLRVFGISSDSLESNICQAVAVGVGKESGDGEAIYSQFIYGNTGLDTLKGLGSGQAFSIIENSIGNALFSSYSADTKAIYSIVTTAALIGGYVSDVDEHRLNRYFSGVYFHLSNYLGSGPSENVFVPDSSLAAYQQAHQYSGALTSIHSSSPKGAETNKIYFKTYDLSTSFSDAVDINLAKDAVIQEYGVTGEFVYSIPPWVNVGNCSEIELPIFNFADNHAIGTRYLVGPSTFPCMDEHTRYEPPSGIQFKRNTADGPYSTGLWTKNILLDYQKQDQEHLQKNQYRNNRFAITDYYGTAIKSSFSSSEVTTDFPNGEFSPAFTREYNAAPTDNQTIHFHVGNKSGLRRANVITGYARQQELNSLSDTNELVEQYDTTGTGLSITTGMRFIPLTLGTGNRILDGTITNPLLPQKRIYDLALNFNTGAYIDFAMSSNAIAGPPQISEIGDLPYIAFYQDFYSRVNNTIPRLSMSFAVSISEVDHSLNKGIPTTFLNIATGVGGFAQEFTGSPSYEADSSTQPNISFELPIKNSDLMNLDADGNWVKSFVLGMGNGLSGCGFSGYQITNCGLNHSGYNFTIPGINTGVNGVLNNLALISGYSGLAPVKQSKTFARGTDYGNILFKNSLMGNSKLYDDILEGWIHPTYGRASVSRMYAYIKSGSAITGEFTYSGFDSENTILDAPNFPRFEITPFASGGPYAGLISSGWTPIIAKQRNGNFFPRYFNGPFATARKKFVYPHAHTMITGSPNYKAISGELNRKNNSGNIRFYNSTGAAIQISQYSGAGYGLNGSVGFPHLVIFDLEVKEYASKEYYSKTQWDSSQVQSTESIFGVDPVIQNITWSDTDSFSKTNTVDENYATPIILSSNIFHMGHTGVNPMVYNSPPNYIHGFINDEIGYLSGTTTEASSEIWPNKLKPDPAAYLVQYKETLGGSSYGKTRIQNPEGNYTFYKTYTRKITGIYTPPGYRMADSHFHPEYAYRLLPTTLASLGENPSGHYGYPGSDPIYFKRMSNIVGVTGVEVTESIHGGAHPKGIFGDSWMNLSYSGLVIDHDDDIYTLPLSLGYGTELKQYPIKVGVIYGTARKPSLDNLVILTEINSTGIGVHFTALSLFPGDARHTTGDFGNSTGFYRSGVTSAYEDGFFNIEEKAFSFRGEVKTGYAYPSPGGNGWSGTPSDGNTVYPRVEQWNKEHTGARYQWRRASKVDFKFKNVVWSGHGQIPYDIEYMVVPSGDCSIRGNFKYNKMKEAPIFSEGVFLADVTPNDDTLVYGSYPQFISDVLKDHGDTVTVEANSYLAKAPSRQLELINHTGVYIKGDYDFKMINTMERDFNKYIVPAISDYSALNASVLPSYEGPPVSDDKTFGSTMWFSANKGQQFPDNSFNPYVMKRYEVQNQYQYYDASLTDAAFDHRFRTSVFPAWSYSEPENAMFVPANVTIREADRGFY